MHWLTRAQERFLSMLYVPKCVGCGVRLPADTKVPLCAICRAGYENEKERTCPVCAARLGDCTCPLPGTQAGVRRLIKLFRYRPSCPDLVSNRMLYRLKHRNLCMLQDFFAAELSPSVRRMTAANPEEYLLTYPPRSRRSMLRYGFDHAAALSESIGRRTGIAWEPTLCRMGGQEQKHLTRAERKENARAGYRLRDGLDLQGRRILLVDDIVTTGATLGAAERLLRRAGAREVIGVVLAVTLKEESVR